MDVKGQSHDMTWKGTVKAGSESNSVILEVFSGESTDLNPRTTLESDEPSTWSEYIPTR